MLALFVRARSGGSDASLALLCIQRIRIGIKKEQLRTEIKSKEDADGDRRGLFSFLQQLHLAVLQVCAKTKSFL